MIATHTNGGTPAELEDLVDRLAEPQKLAALNSLVDNLELIAVIVAGLDGLARKGDTIADTVTEVIGQVRAATRATGMDPRETTEQLATLIPTLAEAAPAIHRVASSAIVHEDAVAVVGEASEALIEGYENASSRGTKLGAVGLLKATGDADVQRGLGFLVEVARVLGRKLAEPVPHETAAAARAADT